MSGEAPTSGKVFDPEDWLTAALFSDRGSEDAGAVTMTEHTFAESLGSEGQGGQFIHHVMNTSLPRCR